VNEGEALFHIAKVARLKGARAQIEEFQEKLDPIGDSATQEEPPLI
jgi:Asp-tRNA(Asn)/Glu-tRNA(Gln) amidotransferase C subunit